MLRECDARRQRDERNGDRKGSNHAARCYNDFACTTITAEETLALQVERTRDRSRIEEFLRRNEAAQVYPLADLDEPFWRDTQWFTAVDAGRLCGLCLLLEGLEMPIVAAVCPAQDAATRWLLEQVHSELPQRFFYNLGPGITGALGPDTEIDSHGTWLKMSLTDETACEPVEDAGVTRLGRQDLEEIRVFRERDAYHDDERGGQFFDARMLDYDCYYGVRVDGRLVSLGGVHVHSKRYGVAALGNVVTSPGFRRRGLARKISATVVRALLRDGISTIGLNVRESNQPGRSCYRGLGFSEVCSYEEGVASRAR